MCYNMYTKTREGDNMSLLAKRSIGKKEAPGGILLIAKEAQNAKALNPNVIDGTIGMIYGEDNKFLNFKVVDKAIKELKVDEKFAYSTTVGNPDYLEAIKKWVFRNHKEEILNKLSCKVIATPGGSGAISNTFTNYLNEGDKVLLPSYMWGIYKQFARENNAGFETYELFNKLGKFNLLDLEYKAKELKKHQGRVFLVINDPCHNPTGYSMSEQEWDNVVSLINELSADNTPVILLYDMAYIDYDLRGLDVSRENIRKFTKFNESVISVLAFSGSKTLGLYGIRIGAQIILGKSSNYVEELYDASIYSSRTKWSMASNLGMNIISHIFNNEELFRDFEKELDETRSLMKLRADTFIDNAKKCGLQTLPFSSGFFVTIPCSNANEKYELLTKMGVYIVPLGNSLRVAISAINVNEAKVLPEIIKSVL